MKGGVLIFYYIRDRVKCTTLDHPKGIIIYILWRPLKIYQNCQQCDLSSRIGIRNTTGQFWEATSSTVTPNLYKPEEAELLTILSVAYIGLISSPVIL